MSKQLFAIFGDPVSHSRSPLMHNSVFKQLNYNACYTRVHLTDGSKLRETFLNLKLSGANITVPHKEEAFKACDEVRGFATKIGVVNTIVKENGKLIGYNTDADGFLFSISEFKNIKTILILGAGGTAKALSQKFSDEGFEVTILNRSENRLQSYTESGFKTFTWESFEIKKYDLVINTTSAGLQDSNLPAPKEIIKPLLQQSSYVADAIYGKVTPFLALAKELNKEYKDGADMLLGQGVLANNYFTASTFDLKTIEKYMRESFNY
ncbi:MAG: shikimate dehydrogenase [Helicobacteraceae bacterium]|nr:shikimate dehydrogenase [Helicobacteraceae bacterium]